PSR
ncbi:hypothetical protein VCHC80A1_03307B, partial [Vibrio cholerae HC-80A1]